MDVKFLATHGTDSSYLFLVDSATRDLTFHPEASEYVVRFNSPFENVVGIDLVDASVPRTEYVVETGANTLAFTYGGGAHTAVVPPGDYNLAQLVETLGRLLPGDFTVAASSSPAEIANRVTFAGTSEFTIDVAASTIRRALGLGVRGAIRGSPGPLGTAAPLLTGPLPTTRITAPLDAAVRQVFTAPANGVPTACTVFASSTSAGAVSVTVARASDDAVVASGSAVVGGAGFQQLDCTLTAAGPVVAGGVYYVRLLATDARVYATGPGVDSLVDGAWTGGADALCVNLSMTPSGFVADAPNLVDLTGERYLCVRCPEVESHLYRDRAYETMHAGLGMVKLGGYGVLNQRYDFVSVPSRRLRTPLGKLRTLTIRLEKANGALYSTKGVDHHLLLAVHYREVHSQPDVPRPPLFPDYQPNPTVAWRK